MKALLAVVMLTCAAPNLLAGQDESWKTLVGVTNVQLVVNASEAFVAARLDTTALRTTAELRLRQAGVPMGELDAQTVILVISVEGFAHDNGAMFSYNLTARAYQLVMLTRDSSITTLASTWDQGYYGTVGRNNVKGFRDDVATMAESFANDFLAANPRR